MSFPLRSDTTFRGSRRMAGARALWRANGMDETQMGRPVIAIVNSFTQFVPGHTHLHDIGQEIKAEIESLGCFAAEFNTIAIDDGIAMGHDGMLYSLPSRDLIADSVEYMANAHLADAMVCISNCDKVTPGMLMAAVRLNIPAIFVSGGPMEAGEIDGRHIDLVDIMVESADTTVDDATVSRLERHGCPTCGSCSGMFTANSMNSLNEAIGMALPGNGTIVATHANRRKLFRDAARLIVKNAYAYYRDGDTSVLPRSIISRASILNAMALDIAMGGSTNTVLHLLAIASEAGAEFSMADIDSLSRRTPVLCKVAPNSSYHIQDVNRAGGILSIMSMLADAGLIDTSVRRADGLTLRQAIDRYAINGKDYTPEADTLWHSAPGGTRNLTMASQDNTYNTLDTDRTAGCIRDMAHAYASDGGIAVLYGNIARNGCVVKTAGVDEPPFRGPVRPCASVPSRPTPASRLSSGLVCRCRLCLRRQSGRSLRQPPPRARRARSKGLMCLRRSAHRLSGRIPCPDAWTSGSLWGRASPASPALLLVLRRLLRHDKREAGVGRDGTEAQGRTGPRKGGILTPQTQPHRLQGT